MLYMFGKCYKRCKCSETVCFTALADKPTKEVGKASAIKTKGGSKKDGTAIGTSCSRSHVPQLSPPSESSVLLRNPQSSVKSPVVLCYVLNHANQSRQHLMPGHQVNRVREE